MFPTGTTGNFPIVPISTTLTKDYFNPTNMKQHLRPTKNGDKDFYLKSFFLLLYRIEKRMKKKKLNINNKKAGN